MRRTQFAALLTAALLLVSALPAAAGNQPEPQHRASYLALGNSVAFGFDPLVTDRDDPDNFVGYPEALADLLELGVVNASCPGEASAGFIDFSGIDNGCRLYREESPLHVDYDTTQLDFAVAFLRHHRHVDLVTIDVGANDVFVFQRECKGDPACIIGRLPSIAKNLATIYGGIRGEAGYEGTLAALTYYLTDYTDPLAVALVGALNKIVATVTLEAGGQVADGFGTFAKAAAPFGGSSCKAGLLIVLPNGTCDIHPSPQGRDLLAEAIRAALPDTK